jgi:peptide methionine sulfoxide reductase msrA/msrB
MLLTFMEAQDKMKRNKLTPEESHVIINKGTEPPFSGKYWKFDEPGTYICKHCDTPLYYSTDKFNSHCGWPSFDDEIPGAIKRQIDADGRRTEILCANCDGHLGHVFEGERLTDKNIRHCVNSLSIKFIPAPIKDSYRKVYFGGGCFWGTEYYFQKVNGVISTSVGYIGGHQDNPTYKEVCSGKTGHAEVVEVIYDSEQVTYIDLAKLFFEIHDFTQVNRQGPDIGDQYRTEVFVTTDDQKETTDKLIEILRGKGYEVATKVTKADKFWKAEDYHQDYYDHKGTKPYCHFYTKKFD